MRKTLAFMLVLALASVQFSSLAFAVTTPSNATTKYETASPADAEIIDDLHDPGIYMDPIDLTDWLDPDNGIVMSSDDGIPAITNTIDYSGARIQIAYYDMSGVIKYYSARPDNSGYVSFKSAPSDLASIANVGITLEKSALPSPGKYRVSVVYRGNAGYNTTYDDYAQVYSQKHNSNAATQTSSYDAREAFLSYSTDYYFNVPVDLSNVNYLQFLVKPSIKTSRYFPCSGWFYVNFTKLDSNAPVDTTTAGGATTDMDIQQNISDSSSEIASNTASMADTLKEIVQTISNQLASLWDQMFNLMHVPQLANDDKNTQRIIDKLGDDLNVEIQNDNDNIDRVIENDNENTETIVNGYDTSGMDSSNDTLDQGMQKYDAAESAVVDEVSGYLTDFEFPLYTSLPVSVVTACMFFGNYLQELFEAMGAFNFPITLSLTMIFVLILIGYHRVRSNG